MIFQRLFPLCSLIMWLIFPGVGLANLILASGDSSPNYSTQDCEQPALSRLKKHTIVAGETLESIARQYNLIPATLMGFNPILRRGTVPVGHEIWIPPYNGIAVRIPAGQTWRDIAKTYQIRADVLFEINGCEAMPPVVFVPGVNWSPGYAASPSQADLKGYPLPAAATVIFGYGWQLHPVTGQVVFHSGIDFLASPGTPVLAIGEGTVAYASEQGVYGNLVVINHQAGKQSRYAHLNTITVTVGQKVTGGEVIGTVGTTGQPDMSQPHLHWEIRYNSPLGWVAEDPKPYLKSDHSHDSP